MSKLDSKGKAENILLFFAKMCKQGAFRMFKT